VDLDHPHCLVFLREDCQHVTDFFRARGVAVLSMRELFDYVTDPALGLDEARWEEHLDRLSEAAAQRPEQTDEQKLSEAVFKGAFIPRDLSQVGWSHTNPSSSHVGQGNTCELRTHRTIDEAYRTIPLPQASLSRVRFGVVGKLVQGGKGRRLRGCRRMAGRRQSCEWTVDISTRVMDRLPSAPHTGGAL
jgi:hypothetical protein